METYYSEEECNARLVELLSGDHIAPTLSEAVASALTADLGVKPDGGSQDSDPLEVKMGSWVIRDEDFDLLDILKDSALLFLTTQATGPVAPSLIACAVTLARLLLTLDRKGVSLSGDTLLVFTALRQSDEGTLLGTLLTALGDQWTHERVERALELLTAVPSRSAPVELATKLPDGRWIARA